MASHYRKITQALNLLAARCGQGGRLNRMKAIKLLYFADRYHLRKYGRSVTDDQYVAMTWGSVGSLAKDICEDSAFLDEEAKRYAERFISPDGQYEYHSVGGVDEQVFSETDREALDFAVKHFAKLDQFELADLTHAYPEWKKHERQVTEAGTSVPMAYEDFFSDPADDDPILQRLCPNGDVFQEVSDPAAREAYEEARKRERLWD
jgi:uncharacterized phage-associated protein